MGNLDYALAEEIGDPDLFVGRHQEMTRLLKWADNTKRRVSLSTGILSRRKKGKTALLQRFFNILYDRNDPQLIPFYYRIPEERSTKSSFGEAFYRRFLSQYFAFTLRQPEMVNQVLSLADLKNLAQEDSYVAADISRMEAILERFPDQAWGHARDAGHRLSTFKDVRVVQILDEFQYLNKWIVSDTEIAEDLCYSYMGTAESKFSPQIVAGSYIGWLGAILSHMTGRYQEWRLEGLSDEAALEAVYNYAYVYRVPITDETAPYIAEVCLNDPFYIASTIRNQPEEKDLTTRDGVREALLYETVMGQGEIARVWREYLLGAFAEVNDRNARAMVLYLASHEPEERTRKQIREDLGLEISENDLEKRLNQLVMADILGEGSTNFRYRGLGDRIFAMVFRRIYGEEIERVSVRSIEDDFKHELDSTRRKAAWHRGQAAEFKVCYRLQAAWLRGATLADVIIPPGSPQENGPDNFPLGPFATIQKSRIYLVHEKSVEIDVHAASAEADGTDLMIEVKDWEKDLTRDVVQRFIEVKEALASRFERKTVFLFYSEGGLRDELAAMLQEAGILLLDPDKLAGFETPAGL